MTPEKQRIAIAEACGWNSKSDFQINANLRYHATWVESENRGFFIPDYLNDLNAMHEAWQLLTREQKLAYRGEIALIASREVPNRQSYWLEDIAAEFGHEAYLRTIGKWEVSHD